MINIKDFQQQVQIMVDSQSIDDGYLVDSIKPCLEIRTAFSTLDKLGHALSLIGAFSVDKALNISDRIIMLNQMGSYVVAGSCLIGLLECDFRGVLDYARRYIIAGDRWYVADILGERPLGHALLTDFEKGTSILKVFLRDENIWVKRAIGVAVHFYSKRQPGDRGKACQLLDLLAPAIVEKRKEVAKGIGWGLKTIGKHHPDLLVSFLKNQTRSKQVPKLLINKASAYLSEPYKEELSEGRI